MGDDRQRKLAADLDEMLRFASYHPDVDYMAGLLIQAFDEGRYAATLERHTPVQETDDE